MLHAITNTFKKINFNKLYTVILHTGIQFLLYKHSIWTNEMCKNGQEIMFKLIFFIFMCNYEILTNYCLFLFEHFATAYKNVYNHLVVGW